MSRSASTHLVPRRYLCLLGLAFTLLPCRDHRHKLVLVARSRFHRALLRHITSDLRGAGLLLARALVALLHRCKGRWAAHRAAERRSGNGRAARLGRGRCRACRACIVALARSRPGRRFGPPSLRSERTSPAHGAPPLSAVKRRRYVRREPREVDDKAAIEAAVTFHPRPRAACATGRQLPFQRSVIQPATASHLTPVCVTWEMFVGAGKARDRSGESGGAARRLGQRCAAGKRPWAEGSMGS